MSAPKALGGTLTRRERMSARMVVADEQHLIRSVCDGDAGPYLRSVVTVEMVLEAWQNVVEATRDLEEVA